MMKVLKKKFPIEINYPRKDTVRNYIKKFMKDKTASDVALKYADWDVISVFGITGDLLGSKDKKTVQFVDDILNTNFSKSFFRTKKIKVSYVGKKLQMDLDCC